MDLNKKGVMFSILAVLISVLLITVYSTSTQTQSITTVAQVNSRAELFDSLFQLLENNIETIVGATTLSSLDQIANTQEKLYNSGSGKSYDFDIHCEFPKVMQNKPIRIFPNGELPNDLVLNITNSRNNAACGSINTFFINEGFSYVQKFTSQGVVATDRIGLMLGVGSGNPEFTVQVLDSCKNILGEYKGPANFTNGYCMTKDYILDRQVLFEKGKDYYIYVTINGSLSDSGRINATAGGTIEEGGVLVFSSDSQDVYTYGGNDTINSTVDSFMIDYSNFLKKYYNVSTSYSFKDLKLTQEDPWSVIVDGKLNVGLRDSFFSVNKTVRFTKQVSIIGLKDPYFSKYTIDRKIVEHQPKNETTLNISDVIAIQNNMTFIKDSNSIKYLDRFSDTDKKSTCCGIMTFVTNSTANSAVPLIEFSKYSSKGTFFLNQTVFCKINGSEISNVTHIDLPNDFRLDDSTLTKFNISNSIPGVSVRPWCS